MQIPDMSAMVDSWTSEVEEIEKIVDAWEGSVIYIEVNQSDLDNNEKYKKIMRKWDIFKQNIEKRLEGLRNKIIKVLHKIYDEATKRLEPHKTLAEMLVNFSGDLGAVVNALKQIGQFFLAGYNETIQTIQAVLALAAKVITLTNKLSNLSPPKIVLKDNTEISLPPPKWEPISVDDIIAG